MDSLAIIRQQIRSVVDPMFLRLMQRLYDHPNSTYLRESVVPPAAIVRVVQQYIQTEGATAEMSFPLGESMSEGTCVRLGNDQKLYRSLSTEVTHAGKCIGLLKQIDGENGIVCMFGRLSLPSVWTSLPQSSFLFVSPTGSVQPTVPATGFVQRIGVALSPSSVFVYPLDTSIVLA